MQPIARDPLTRNTRRAKVQKLYNWRGLFGLLAIPLLSSCYTVQRFTPVTAEEVVSLTRDGKEPEEIIAKIDQTGTVYNLKSRQVRTLLDEGVDERVVDHMLETRIKAERARARYYYQPHYHSPHIHFRFRHGYCY